MSTNNLSKEAFAPLSDKNLVGHLIGHPLNSQGQHGTHITGISDAPTGIPNRNNPDHEITQYDLQMAKRMQDAGKTLNADTDNTVKALVRIVNQSGLSSGSDLHTSLGYIRGIASMKDMPITFLTDHISSVRATGKDPADSTSFMASYSILSDSAARKTLHDLLESLKHMTIEKEPPHADGVAKAIADIAANKADMNKAFESNKNLKDLMTSSNAFNKAAQSAEQFKAIAPNSRTATIKRLASNFNNLKD